MMQSMKQELADCKNSLADCKNSLAEEKAHSDVIIKFYHDVMHSEECGAHKSGYIQNNASIHTTCSIQPRTASLELVE